MRAMTKKLFETELNALARELESEWKRKDYSWQSFSAIAERGFSRRAFHKVFDEQDTIEWLATARSLPVQHDLVEKFGQPPITLFSNERFFIAVYFWVTPEVTIHDHGFSGAFTNVVGDSLHMRYRYATRERAAGDLLVGDLEIDGIDHLGPGSVHRIEGGRRFIHQVWHIGSPTVTMVARTHKLGNDRFNQFIYYPPTIALRVSDSERLIRQRQMMRYLDRVPGSRFDQAVMRFVQNSDANASFQLILEYIGMRKTRTFERNPVIDDLIEVVRKKHGSCADHFNSALETVNTYRTVSFDKLVDPEHRFLVACLMSLSRREQIERLLRRRFPANMPNDIIIRGLEGVKAAEAWSLKLEDGHMRVVGALVNNRNEHEIARELVATGEVDEEDTHHVPRMCAQLRNLPLLRPLFSAA